MKKQAVLAVSFGTSHLDTLEKNIAAIEKEIGAALPGWTLRRAFTSTIIMKKLASRDGIVIDDVARALEKLYEEGFERVIIQPTHIINGEEYDKLCRMTVPFAEKMSITVGTPLLTSVQDYRDVLQALMASVQPPAQEEAVVFMGHGTEHYANAAYALVDYMLHDFGWDRAFVATVEGYPALEQVMARLKAMPQVRKVRLQPFMVVAGDHARNDMAGGEADSWRSQLEAAGYKVSCVLCGLGEYPAVRRLFALHARKAAGTE